MIFIKFEFMITSTRVDQRDKTQTQNFPLFVSDLQIFPWCYIFLVYSCHSTYFFGRTKLTFCNIQYKKSLFDDVNIDYCILCARKSQVRTFSSHDVQIKSIQVHLQRKVFFFFSITCWTRHYFVIFIIYCSVTIRI